MRIRNGIRLVALAASAAAAVSCGDVVRSSRSPVMLVVNSLDGGPGNKAGTLGNPLDSDVVVQLTSPAPCTTSSPCPTIFNDVGSATFGVVMKDVTVAPTTNNQVTLTRYHVTYRRADGRNTPGIDVPFPFDGAVAVTIPANSTGKAGFELVRTIAKAEAPLIQLRQNLNVITTIADVTFYGADQVGNEVSVTGSIQINFANFSDS